MSDWRCTTAQVEQWLTPQGLVMSDVPNIVRMINLWSKHFDASYIVMETRLGSEFKDIRQKAYHYRSFLPEDICKPAWGTMPRRTKVQRQADAKEERRLAKIVAEVSAASAPASTPAPDPGPAIILHEPALDPAANAEDIVNAFLARLEVLTAENARLTLDNARLTTENVEFMARVTSYDNSAVTRLQELVSGG